MSLSDSSLQRIRPLRGPRSVLCVVVVTKVGVGNGAVVNPGRHQTRVVGHVDHQQCPDLVCDLRKPVVRNLPWVGAGAGDDQLRLVLAGKGGDLVKIEPMVSLDRRRRSGNCRAGR